MKTKIREIIAKHQARIGHLQMQKDLAAKLDFNTQCAAISDCIAEIRKAVEMLEKLL